MTTFLADGPAGVSVVEISGERGSGKTRLLESLAQTAAATGWTVAMGHADPAIPRLRYEAFVDALDDLLAGFDVNGLAGGGQDHVRRLTGIFPGLATLLPPPDRGGPAEHYQEFRAVRALLETLAEPSGVLVALDDVHWAGEESTSLLTHLLRHPPAGRILIAVSHRPRQTDSTLLRALDEARVSGRVRRFSPRQLSAEEAMALLPPDMSRAQCGALMRESDRRPGLLKAMARIRSVPEGRIGVPQVLPVDVLTDSLREFRALSRTALLVAQSAAVLSDPFEPDMVQLVAGVSDVELWEALDELSSEDLIDGDRLSRRLRFGNPLLRAAAYQSAGSGWLLGAHARAAQAMRRHGGSAVRLAPHLVMSASVGDQNSADVLLTAARAHLWEGPAQAALWSGTAMDLRGGSAVPPEDRLLHGQALVLSGNLRDGQRVLSQLRAADSCDVSTWAAAVWWRTRVWHLLGEPLRAGAELAATSLAMPPAGTMAHALVSRARLWHELEVNGDVDGADLAALAGSGSATSRADGLVLMARLSGRRGAALRALEFADEAAAIFDAEPDGTVAEHLPGLFELARIEAELGEPAPARAHLERCLRVAEERQLRSLIPQFAVAMGLLQLGAGQWSSAVRQAAFACTSAQATDSDHLLQQAVRFRARVDEAERLPFTGEASPIVPADDGPDLDEADLETLSRRELEVAVLVSDGRTNQQIARRLSVSHKTVETHLRRIFKKLVVSSRAEVATAVGRSDGYRRAADDRVPREPDSEIPDLARVEPEYSG